MNRFFEAKNKKLIFYFCFLLLLLFVHLFLPLNWADDAIFFEKTAQLNLSEFINNSARPIVDIFTYFFTKYPLLWRFINPFMMVLLSVFLNRYLPGKNEFANIIGVSCAIIYPSMVVVDAGFIATTLNYLWPVTMGLLCFMPLWKKANGCKTQWFENILLIPCLLYATNMQQISVILVLVFGAACVYFIYKKDCQLYIFLQFIISVICTLFSYIINTMGDNSRMLRETNRYFPDFASLSFFEKIELGFSSTFYCLTMEFSLAWFGFFIFLTFLMLMVYKKTKRIGDRVVVSFPLIFSLWGAIQKILPFSVYLNKYVPGELQNYKMNKATYSFEIISDVFYVIVILCVLYSLFILITKNKKRFEAFTIFFLGLGTRMLMGFSPTVWASGYRTFYIFDIALIMISTLIINENYIITKDSKYHHLTLA